MFENIPLIIVASVLTENFLLSKFFGVCPFLGVSGKINGAVGMGAAVVLVMTVAAAMTHPVYNMVLVPLEVPFMSGIAFILIIAALVQCLEMAIKKYMPPLYKSLGVYLPLITTNCAVLGVTTLNSENNYTFIESVVNAFFSGIGFMLVIVLFAGVRFRIQHNNTPVALKGTPITLVSAAIMSLAFLGFGGLGQ